MALPIVPLVVSAAKWLWNKLRGRPTVQTGERSLAAGGDQKIEGQVATGDQTTFAGRAGVVMGPGSTLVQQGGDDTVGAAMRKVAAELQQIRESQKKLEDAQKRLTETLMALPSEPRPARVLSEGALPEHYVVSALGIGSATVEPGRPVTLSVTADVRDPGIGAYTIDLIYDGALVEATGCTSAAGVCSINTVARNTVRITGGFAAGSSGRVILGTVTFRARAAEGMSPLYLRVVTLADPEGQDLTPELLSHGTISLSQE